MNKLTTKKQVQMQLDGPSLAQEVNWGQRSNFSILYHFHTSLTLYANVEKLQKNVGSGTQTIAPIKQTEESLGPVGSVFLIIF